MGVVRGGGGGNGRETGLDEKNRHDPESDGGASKGDQTMKQEGIEIKGRLS